MTSTAPSGRYGWSTCFEHFRFFRLKYDSMSSGPDGISAESLKFSHAWLYVYTILCFSLCLTHGYLPKSLMETTMFPIVKNKCCNLSDSNNYRPIAIATITSKVLESVILVKCEEFLYPSLYTVSLCFR